MFYPPGYCHMGKKNMFDGFKQYQTIEHSKLVSLQFSFRVNNCPEVRQILVQVITNIEGECPIQLQELGTEFEIPQQRLGLSSAELILLRFVEYFRKQWLEQIRRVRCFEAFGWKFLTQWGKDGPGSWYSNLPLGDCLYRWLGAGLSGFHIDQLPIWELRWL